MLVYFSQMVRNIECDLPVGKSFGFMSRIARHECDQNRSAASFDAIPKEKKASSVPAVVGLIKTLLVLCVSQQENHILIYVPERSLVDKHDFVQSPKA